MNQANGKKTTQEGPGQAGESLGAPSSASSPTVLWGGHQSLLGREGECRKERERKKDKKERVLPPRDQWGRFVKGPSRGKPRQASQSRDSDEETGSETESEMSLQDISDYHLSDSDSNEVTVRSPIITRRKRPSTDAPAVVHPDSDDGAEGVLAPKLNTARRGRRAAVSLRSCVVDVATESMTVATEGKEDSTETEVEQIKAEVGRRLTTILGIADGFKNYKKELGDGLREAAAALQSLVESLANRNEREEVQQLKAENRRLRQQVAECKADVAELRRKFQGLKADAPAASAEERQAFPDTNSGLLALGRELERSLTITFGKMLSARLEALEGRLLPAQTVRPPLKADARKKTTQPAARMEPESGKSGKKSALARTRPAITTKTATITVHQEDGFTVVQKRKRKGKNSLPLTSKPAPATRASVAKPPKPKAPAASKRKVVLKVPKTAAVVYRLHPEAEKRGLTYAEVLQSAMERVDTHSMEIDGVRFKVTQTGARMLEVSGPRSAEKADLLANRLRELWVDVADVSRPVKCSDLSLTGLTDAATKEGVGRAVAEAGGCDRRLVRVGEIRRRQGGAGSCLVSCPVPAAKLLSAKGSLLVGFGRARVVALRARPMRCYKCMGLGHTRPLCPSATDRGSLCFRCGETGHKAAVCQRKDPRCAICAESGRPSGHTMGGRSCFPPKTLGVAPKAWTDGDGAGQQAPQEETAMAE